MADQASSGAGSTAEDMQAFGKWWLSPAMRASLPLSQQGGAAAAWRERQKDIDQLRADLAATQAEIERLKQEVAEERATTLGVRINRDIHVRQENEARATIERQNAVITAARELRDAKEAVRRRGWAALLREADAYQAFFKALDRASTETTKPT